MENSLMKISDIKANPNNPRLYECLNCKEKFSSRKWCATRQPKYCSKKCFGKSQIIDKHKNCIWCWKYFETYKKEQKYCSLKCASVIHSKENCHWWKWWITWENELERKTSKYKKWRTSVFERDKYTCQECSKRWCKIHADHIKPFAYFKELRFDLNNGRTLCVECHYKTDTYWYKSLKYGV